MMKDKKITVTGVNTDVLKFYDKHPNGGYQSATVELDICLPLNSSLSEAESIIHKSFLMLEVDVIDKYKHMKEIKVLKEKQMRISEDDVIKKVNDLIERGFRITYKNDRRGTVYKIDDFIFLRRVDDRNKFQLWIKGKALIDSDDKLMYMSQEDGESIYIYIQEKLKEQENNEEKQKFKSIKNYLNDIL